MEEKRKQEIIEAQRLSMQLGTVHHEIGLEVQTTRGYIGTTSLGAQTSMFGMSGGEIAVVIIADRTTFFTDQECIQIPMNKVLKIVFEPYIP